MSDIIVDGVEAVVTTVDDIPADVVADDGSIAEQESGFMDSLNTVDDAVTPEAEAFKPTDFDSPMLDHMRNELIINAGDNGMALVNLYESGEHISVDGSISQELHDLAKETGLSDSEINQVRSRFMDDVANAKAHAEELVGADTLADTMEFVHANFTEAELDILKGKLTEDADEALVFLVQYVKSEKDK